MFVPEKSHFTSFLNTITSEYESIQGTDAVMCQTVHNSKASWVLRSPMNAPELY